MSNRIKLALLWAGIAWACSLALSYVPSWKLVEAKLFDLATLAAAPHKSLLHHLHALSPPRDNG
ncbi:MAG: hypothetical protein H7842_12900 [Gammaproteobacteria bacterium SHHR-1]